MSMMLLLIAKRKIIFLDRSQCALWIAGNVSSDDSIGGYFDDISRGTNRIITFYNSKDTIGPTHVNFPYGVSPIPRRTLAIAAGTAIRSRCPAWPESASCAAGGDGRPNVHENRFGINKQDLAVAGYSGLARRKRMPAKKTQCLRGATLAGKRWLRRGRSVPGIWGANRAIYFQTAAA